MGKLGFGYGGEWHLLRYLGRHRQELTQRVLELAPDVKQIEWLDFNFTNNDSQPDAELKGLEFLPTDHPARIGWSSFWPQRGNVQNWDAVALATTKSGKSVWLLVEAKGNLSELSSNCQAKNAGLATITNALNDTKRLLNVSSKINWLRGYYQHANRLAVMLFLNKHESGSARLLQIYFLNDQNPKNSRCPKTAQDWMPHLIKRDRAMGIENHPALTDAVLSLFLNIRGSNVTE